MIRLNFSVPVEFEDVPIGIDLNQAWAEVSTNNARASLAEHAWTGRFLNNVLNAEGGCWSGPAADCLVSSAPLPQDGAATCAGSSLDATAEAAGSWETVFARPEVNAVITASTSPPPLSSAPTQFVWL